MFYAIVSIILGFILLINVFMFQKKESNKKLTYTIVITIHALLLIGLGIYYFINPSHELYVVIIMAVIALSMIFFLSFFGKNKNKEINDKKNDK